MMMGSGVTAYAWPGTGQMVISQRAVNTHKNERWSYQRRSP